MSLEEENEQLKAENAALKRQLAQALERVVQLEAQLALNSRNSSKPPSSAAFVRPPKNRSLRQATTKKPGAQVGHEGHTLSWNDHPDQIVDHLPEQCSECHTELAEVAVASWQSHQVLDLPQGLKLITTEHRAGRKLCPHCHKLNQAPCRKRRLTIYNMAHNCGLWRSAFARFNYYPTSGLVKLLVSFSSLNSPRAASLA